MEDRNSYCGYRTAGGASGQMIRELRKKLQLSQENMAYGICSVQKYSRIESGKDAPTELEFSGLMNRLGEPQLYYGDFYCDGSDKRLSLRALIRDEAMLDHWDRISELLYTYSLSFPPIQPEDRQFYGFYETILCYMTGDTVDGLVLSEMCRDLLMICRPGVRFTSKINFTPTQSEFILLNAIAIGLSETGIYANYKKAVSLLDGLLVINRERLIPALCRNTRIALLLNLCLIETENGDYTSAEKNLDLLLHNLAFSGGTRLYHQALECRITVLEHTGRIVEASELRYCMCSVFHINSEKSHHKVLVF